ncbi:MAG: hypothetical protein M3352_11835 [Bacteroidota bacterium]|nr:hypothetical protein [Bacteroidota bacterium]
MKSSRIYHHNHRDSITTKLDYKTLQKKISTLPKCSIELPTVKVSDTREDDSSNAA